MKTKIRLARLAVVLGIGACLLTLPAPAQDSPERVGRWPYGLTFAVAASGDYVYFGSGRVLAVADVTNPAGPQVIGHRVLPDVVNAVEVSGLYAYVLVGNKSLKVIDFRDPSRPVVVATVRIHRVSDIVVSGTYAYVIDGGLRVFDVSVPSAPVEIASLPVGGVAHSLDGDGLFLVSIKTGQVQVARNVSKTHIDP